MSAASHQQHWCEAFRNSTECGSNLWKGCCDWTKLQIMQNSQGLVEYVLILVVSQNPRGTELRCFHLFISELKFFFLYFQFNVTYVFKIIKHKQCTWRLGALFINFYMFKIVSLSGTVFYGPIQLEPFLKIHLPSPCLFFFFLLFLLFSFHSDCDILAKHTVFPHLGFTA